MPFSTKQLEAFPQIVDLDELDKKILTILQEDGKTSLRKIADDTKHSVSTIKAHVDTLIEKGVIENFIAVVNCNKVGYREMIHLYIQVIPAIRVQAIVDRLLQITSINAIYHISGDFSLFCIAKCVERKDQIELLEQVKAIPGIEKIRTQMVLQRIKEDMRVRIPE